MAAPWAHGLCRPRAGDTVVLRDTATCLLEGLAGSSSSCPAWRGELRPSSACTARHPVGSWGLGVVYAMHWLICSGGNGDH